MRLEDYKEWRGIDKDVRDEILGILESCQDSSVMNDPGHPKHDQYQKALDAAKRMLVVQQEGE